MELVILQEVWSDITGRVAEPPERSKASTIMTVSRGPSDCPHKAAVFMIGHANVIVFRDLLSPPSKEVSRCL